MRKCRRVSGLLAVLLASAGMLVAAAPNALPPENAIGTGSANDALFAIESNRLSIVDRVMSNLDAQMKRAGADMDSVRNGLMRLRADQLLSASLSNSLRDVSLLLAEPVAPGAATHRYVTVSPTSATGFIAPEAASSFVLRIGDDLSLTTATELLKAAPGARVVGYFVPNVSVNIGTTGSSGPEILKDGSGTGSGSWIGFVAGGNIASGTSSAAAAGSNNVASGSNSFVGAGFANQANGISSLVMGGFDNRATNTDSLVGAGAGNRATGARAVIVGGGYNLASGNFSFIGGGGRDGIASTVAGTDGKDHINSATFGAIVGGQGNRVSGTGGFVGAGSGNAAAGIRASVVGGSFNQVPGDGAFIGGGSGNDASGSESSVAGGAKNWAFGSRAYVGGGGCNMASGAFSAVVGGGGQLQPFFTCEDIGGNTASGDYSFVAGGRSNKAMGLAAVALGVGARAIHDNSLVFSDGNIMTSAAANSFNVRASGGVVLHGSTSINMGSTTRQNISLWGSAGEYGIGVQSATPYFRTDSNVATGGVGGFAWFAGGTHSDSAFDPGTGGNTMMKLTRPGSVVLPSASAALIIPELLNGAQQIQLRGGVNGLGAQSAVTYLRTNSDVAFYQGGVHATGGLDAGGGNILATIQSGAGSATVIGNVRALGFTATSDRAAKTAFAAVNARTILAKVASLPISTWMYNAERSSGVRHIGPVAQDFARAFNVGYDDKSISTIDASGVALSAIKGINELLKEKDAKIDKLEREMAAIKKKLGM